MREATVTGTIRMPPGITQADVTVTYLSVLRTGGSVAGGTVKAVAGADGVPKASGQPLKLQVAYPGDLVERHPYAKVAVSYRGAAAGYEFLVDLAVEDGATTLDLGRAVGGMSLMTPEQATTVQGLIADFDRATLDLSGEWARVDAGLDGIAQSTQTLMQAAGIGRVATEADLASKPAGIYELTGSNERLEWTGQAIKPGSRGPALAEASRINAAPIAAPAQTRGTLLRGGVPYYPAPAGLVADGVTVIEEATGLYYRATDNILPWEAGALPGTATVRRNSGEELAAWVEELSTRGGNLTLPPGFWYTDRILEVAQDDVSLNWRGALRPAAGYTGYLLKIGGPRTLSDLWGADSMWQNPAQAPRIVVDGMHESKGIWLQNLDHYDIQLFAGRTWGCALQVDRCREGQVWPVIKHAYAAAEGESLDDRRVAVIRVHDQGDGDANNSMSFYDTRVVYPIGRSVSVDTPLYDPAVPGRGSVARFIHFLGNTQLEHLGYAFDFGQRGTLQPYSGPKVNVGRSNSVTFEGQFSPGKLATGKSMFEVGSVDSGGMATEFTLRSTLYGGDAHADSHIVLLDNCNGYHVDVQRAQLAGVQQVVKKGANAQATQRVTETQDLTSGDTALRLRGLVGLGRSASQEFVSSDGAKTGRQFLFDSGQLVTQPDKSKGYLFTQDGQGRQFVQGDFAQLGATNLGYDALIYRLRNSEPPELPDGVMCWCDGVGWNPLSRATGKPYPVFRIGGQWLGVTLSPY